MKIKIKQISLAVSFLLLLTVIVVACFEIRGVSVNQGTKDEPQYWVKAGDIATFTMTGHIAGAGDPNYNQRFIGAILVPKSWKARENMTASYVATELEDGSTSYPMELIPVSESPKNNQGLSWAEALMQKKGVGSNVLDDMEWVTFQSVKVYTFSQNQPDFTITFKCKTGLQNLKARISFFVNYSGDGLGSNDKHYAFSESEQCFEVREGEGGLIDFCAYHFNKVDPLAALQDDYITFSFVGDAYDNDLISEDKIYLKATAYTDNGNKYSVDVSEKTLMEKEDRSFVKTYNLTMWPIDFFGINADETITKIEYFFTNADGTVVVSKSDDDEAAEGMEIEGDKQPFVFEPRCD